MKGRLPVRVGRQIAKKGTTENDNSLYCLLVYDRRGGSRGRTPREVGVVESKVVTGRGGPEGTGTRRVTEG